MKDVIANTVYEARMRRELTQEELAKAVGVSRQTIVAIEKGNYTPSVLLALHIARFFNKTVEQLFTIRHEK